MSGVVLGSADLPGRCLPAVSPIFFQRADRATPFQEMLRSIGPMEVGDPLYRRVNERLEEIERDVALFALSSTGAARPGLAGVPEHRPHGRAGDGNGSAPAPADERPAMPEPRVTH
ncbi:MAG TPA: hypothetical protein VF601_08115 [Beijerinckiaceae bacterium]